MVTPAVGREMTHHLTATYKVSQRRACRVVGIHRTTVRYRPQRRAEVVAQEEQVQAKLVELAEKRPRFGYRRLIAGWQCCSRGKAVQLITSGYTACTSKTILRCAGKAANA